MQCISGSYKIYLEKRGKKIGHMNSLEGNYLTSERVRSWALDQIGVHKVKCQTGRKGKMLQYQIQYFFEHLRSMDMDTGYELNMLETLLL